MSTNRRDFLRDAGVCALTTTALGSQVPRLLAAPRTGTKPRQRPTLVAVYLRGGADALSTIVPYADKRYPQVRRTLALTPPDGRGKDKTLSLDNQFAFNPNMIELHALYRKGMCVPIVSVGSPHPTRSHFDAQDFMERGAPGLKSINTGWLNRYLSDTRSTQDANLRAVSFQSQLPRALRGEYPVLAKPDQKADLALQVYSQLYPHKPTAIGRPKFELLGAQSKAEIQEFGARTIDQLSELTLVLEDSPPPTVKYPDSGFARQLCDVAKVIKAERGLEITAIDYGGWDHHTDEGPIDGQLGKRLADVSGSVGAFLEDLGPVLSSNVLVLIMSEFGRTVQENGTKGTDHGHGGFMIAAGGRLNGEQVYGKWDGLDDGHLYERRDLEVTTDFRDVFADVLHGLYKFDSAKQKLFPEYTLAAQPLNMMQRD
jgi:uncharacterized protein (DUF1501 family)